MLCFKSLLLPKFVITVCPYAQPVSEPSKQWENMSCSLRLLRFIVDKEHGCKRVMELCDTERYSWVLSHIWRVQARFNSFKLEPPGGQNYCMLVQLIHSRSPALGLNWEAKFGCVTGIRGCADDGGSYGPSISHCEWERKGLLFGKVARRLESWGVGGGAEHGYSCSVQSHVSVHCAGVITLYAAPFLCALFLAGRFQCYWLRFLAYSYGLQRIFTDVSKISQSYHAFL